ANGGEEPGASLAAALPEPIPVPESPATDDDTADEEFADRPAESEPSETHAAGAHATETPATETYESTSVRPSEPAGGFYPEPFDSAPVTNWEAPLPPAESAAAEPSEAPEPHEEPEPTLAAWQEEWQLQGARPADQENADQKTPHPAAGWDEGHADHAGNPASEPDSIALRVAEESVVAAEIADATSAGNGAENEAGSVETLGGDEVEEVEEADAEQRRRYPVRHYKIQEVIKRRQIMLVQVAKEERGNKGAALTTYLSLAGRYCVLMPNTGRGGGISRKISNPADRKRMKEMLAELDVPAGMGVILRTAGLERCNIDIKRDYEYLSRLWDSIRELTMRSTAPALIYEDSDLIKRSLRDVYDTDIQQVLVEGEAGHQAASEFMRQ